MKKILNTFFITIILLTFFAVPQNTQATTDIQTGDYIKLEKSSAIYRITENHERQYFTAGWIFKCYQTDYTNVKILPENFDLEIFPSSAQSVMPPLSGCGLAKSPASPSVYAFDNTGTRHKIKDEATARTLYGANWAAQIYDIPDFIFSLFPIGTPLAENNSVDTSPIRISPRITDAPSIWRPTPGTTWNWQLDSVPESDFEDVAIYDLDYEDATKADVTRLHAAGKKAICYISVGSWENWRADAHDFPKEILGDDYDGWQGEKWLDIRNTKLYPILEKRFDICKKKGFDGIEPDNIDGYDNDTGFDISPADQIVFNKWLASEAHKRGLSIGLKNDPDQATELEAYFDWALTEDCVADDWCDDVKIFTTHGKAVFQTEYLDNSIDFKNACTEAKQNNFSLILKNRDLDEYVKICR
jgi:hypothetical protein